MLDPGGTGSGRGEAPAVVVIAGAFVLAAKDGLRPGAPPRTFVRVMYYDRSLPESYSKMLSERWFFARLIELVRSPWGADILAHIEFRRSNSRRHKRGSVKVYVGRSSLLEVTAKADGTFTLSAHRKYTAAAPDLFGPRFSPTALDEIAEVVEEYMRTVVSNVGKQFTEGEGRVHAGFIRRHGLSHQVDDPLAAVDKEVVVGFAKKTETDAFNAELRRRFGEAHRELDTIGVLADGNIAVVELKNEKESVEVAAVQAASHVLTFVRLSADRRQHTTDFDLGDILNRLIDQKVAVGLLPEHAYRAKPDAGLVPVIAAPDSRPGWAAAWRSGLQRTLDEPGDLLAGLQMWRLSPDGEVVDVASA